MRFDSLLTPVSEAEPCGPDLDEVGDDAYLNYTLGADNRLPARYLDAETGAPFDRGGIDLKAETRTIVGFLERSRDLRLLTLDARFQALAGQISGVADSVQTIAALLGAFWDGVHPRGQDGDFTMRQNTVAVLDDRTTVVLPLRYAPILSDSRVGTISLHDYLLATGATPPRDGERVLDVNQIMDLVRSEAQRPAIDAVHAALTTLRASLAAIGTAFDTNTDYTYSASFDLLAGVAGDILKFIEAGRADLRTAPESAEPPAAANATEEIDRAAVPSPAGSARLPDIGPVKTHAAAAAALLGAERYFGRYEPSSPALILIHQARLLVGKPLVEALEALVPDGVEYASISVDPASGFALGIAKMRAITEDYAAGAETSATDGEDIPEFNAETRAEALQLLSTVSAFFRVLEPSSPVPMMLGRAERFVNQNFQAILSELLPRPAG